MDMPNELKGHVNANKDGSYTIFINAKLNIEEQQKTYLHEIGHIHNGDFEKFDVDEIEGKAHGM